MYIKYLPIAFLFLATACHSQKRIKPLISSEPLNNDPDDVAIWIHPSEPLKSIVFLNDKSSNGGVFGFDISGKPLANKSIQPLLKPNNLDIVNRLSNPFKHDSLESLLVITERETQRIRIFNVPDLNSLDSGGFIAFAEDSSGNSDFHAPMGIAVMSKYPYENLDVFVSRKFGPNQKYLNQYKAFWTSDKQMKLNYVRSFGTFSGIKEIEALAIDTFHNRIYYSDENYGIRYASTSPDKIDTGSFGIGSFKSDCEGIAVIYTLKKFPNGLIVVSDQQRNNLNFFDRNTHKFIGFVEIEATETDGIDFSTLALVKDSEGTLFTMNDLHHNFHYYPIESLIRNIKKPN